MKKLQVISMILLMSLTQSYAFTTWDDCIERYNKAKQFSGNTRLFYNYLKSTKNCLVEFKNILEHNPDPEFTVKAMNNNIDMLDGYINELLPEYSFAKNNLEEIPKYVKIDSSKPIVNEEYENFKKFDNCNGVHAKDKIYTAKHCKVDNSKNIRFDLNFIQSDDISKLEVSKLNLSKLGTFKYYSMSKEGMFYNVLLKEQNCKFYKAKNDLAGLNTTLDLTDLSKKEEIRSSCLAIPSNSGGGVFQEGKLVGIISKTVFEGNKFLYSVVEPILPINDTVASAK